MVLIPAVLLALSLAGSPQAASDPVTDPEQDPASLRILEAALAGAPGDYEIAWRVARARFHVASRLKGKEGIPLLEAGIEAGSKAVALRPDRVEGHYWLAACVGRLAEAKGGLKALRSTRRLRSEMEAVLRIDPKYENCDAYQALGRLDRELPGLFGGDKKRGLRYLEEGVRCAPGNMELRRALAEAREGSR